VSDTADRDRFLRDYVKALEDGRAAFFAGAGLSKAAGYIDWAELLREFAEELGLNIDEEHDFPLVAQYHLDEHNNSRGLLSSKLRESFEGDATTEVYRQLARLRLPVVWTTNYDTAVERAFDAEGLKPDVKPNGTKGAWTTSRHGSGVTVYKMHGDISDPDNVVLSRDDYDIYASKYPYVLDTLRSHLIERTFLFAGFSFTDPNLDHVLSTLRAYWGNGGRVHWVLVRLDTDGRKQAKQRLWARHLKRYGMNVVFLKDHAEVLELLQDIETRLRRRHVLVSGSASTDEPLGRPRLDELCAKIGRLVVSGGRTLVCGIGLGVGSAVLTGAAEAVYESDDDPARRLRLYPFPRPPADTREEVWTKWRVGMVRTAGFAVFVAGNKLDDGKIVPAGGVRQEYELAVAAGAYPLPVAATGWVAQEMHDEVLGRFDELLPGAPRDAFELLGRPDATDDEILSSLRRILDALTPQR
jgi:hypothetical protein